MGSRSTARASRWDGFGTRAGRAHGGAPAAAHAVVDGLLLQPRTRRRCATCWRREHFDLIFVHCSSVAQYVEARAGHSQDPRLRRHGFAEVARVRALQAVSRCRWATGSKAEAAARREAPGAALRSVHRDHARRMADARRLRHRRGHRLVPQRRRCDFFSPGGRPLRRRHHQLHRPDGLLPEPGMHVRLLRNGVAARCRPTAVR